MLNGDMAFKLDPLSGTISGTPQLSLSSAQGRAEVNITCQLALGGQKPEEVSGISIEVIVC